MINVTVWNEYRHELADEKVGNIYPEGIHGQIASFLASDEINVKTATLDMPEHGLTDNILNSTDVLIWWGHMAHNEVSDETVERVCARILRGMGFIALHSAHHSKVFKKLMGTTCNLKWREDAKERLWCCNPTHPIAKGLPLYIELPQEEMYGELFDIPKPDEIIYLGWFNSGEVFRSACTFTRGYGRIFYFQPGHEEYPIFYDSNIQSIVRNAVHWAAPNAVVDEIPCPRWPSLEEI